MIAGKCPQFPEPATHLLDKQISCRRMRALPCLPPFGQAHVCVGRRQHGDLRAGYDLCGEQKAAFDTVSDDGRNGMLH